MDNLVDTSHLMMVHAGTFGGDAARLPLELRREVRVAADKLSVAYRRVLAGLVAHGAALHSER